MHGEEGGNSFILTTLCMGQKEAILLFRPHHAWGRRRQFLYFDHIMHGAEGEGPYERWSHRHVYVQLTEEPLETVFDEDIVVCNTIHHSSQALHTAVNELHTTHNMESSG